MNCLQLESPIRVTAPQDLTDALSLTRDWRKTVSSLKVRCMECVKEELIDALSLTRERVRVWVSENLTLQKLNSTQKKDKHPLPPFCYEIAVLKQRFSKRARIFMVTGWAAGPCFTPIEKWKRAQNAWRG
jgi:hypothetical protein